MVCWHRSPCVQKPQNGGTIFLTLQRRNWWKVKSQITDFCHLLSFQTQMCLSSYFVYCSQVQSTYTAVLNDHFHPDVFWYEMCEAWSYSLASIPHFGTCCVLSKMFANRAQCMLPPMYFGVKFVLKPAPACFRPCLIPTQLTPMLTKPH